MRLVAACSLLCAVGCISFGRSGHPNEGSVVAVGDSILAWNRGWSASIPDVVGRELGLGVTNVAVSGAQVTAGGAEIIPNQLPEGPWEWVLLDGGINDLALQCGCDACEPVLDAILTQDGTRGAMAEVVTRATGAGGKVVILGYYRLPEGAPYFEGCKPWMEELTRRQRAVAAAREGVIFVSAADVVDGTDRSHFDRDRVHPSMAGGERVGRHVAAAMRASGE